MGKRLEELKAELEVLREELNSFDKEEHFDHNQYDDMLDEIYGDFMGMNASRILEECDPIAYRCGFSDYVDGLDFEEFQEYTDLEVSITVLEDKIEDLEGEEDNESN